MSDKHSQLPQGWNPKQDDPVDWRARSQGLENAVRYALAALEGYLQGESGLPFTEPYGAARKAAEYLRSALSLGLPDEEGEEPSALTAMPVAYGAAPPPRGAARENSDVVEEVLEAQADLQMALGLHRAGYDKREAIGDKMLRSLARLHALLAALGKTMFDPATHPDVEHPPLTDEHLALIAKNAGTRAAGPEAVRPISKDVPSVRDVSGEGDG